MAEVRQYKAKCEALEKALFDSGIEIEQAKTTIEMLNQLMQSAGPHLATLSSEIILESLAPQHHSTGHLAAMPTTTPVCLCSNVDFTEVIRLARKITALVLARHILGWYWNWDRGKLGCFHRYYPIYIRRKSWHHYL
jgi:hypothetical protein